MTHEDIDEVRIDERDTEGDVLEASCVYCGVAARFSTTDTERSLGDTFKTHCYSCNSSRRLDLGEASVFRVTDLHPDLGVESTTTPPIYTPDE
jgi:hypothetical protein